MKTLAVAAIAVFVFAGGAGGVSAKAFNVSLDGYCNTFALTLSTFQVYGTRGGCGYTVIDGGTVAKVSGVTYDITNDANDSSEIFTWYFTPVKSGVRNWYLYESVGTSQSLVNSGTYSVVHAVSTHSGPDAVKSKARIMHELPFN